MRTALVNAIFPGSYQKNAFSKDRNIENTHEGEGGNVHSTQGMSLEEAGSDNVAQGAHVVLNRLLEF